jgi:Flp pilus assembly protein protease CpaA
MGPIRLSFLWLFAVAAAYLDLRYRKVPNWLILCALSGGVIISSGGGWSDLRYSLCGFILGLLLLLPAFVLHMVGGGDVKSLAVIGLLVGPHLLWVSFLVGAAVGGMLALVILAARYRPRIRRSPVGERRLIPQKVGALTLPYAGILSVCAAIYTLIGVTI